VRELLMPIYEYACKKCTHQFEALVLKATVPACPACKTEDLERRFSLPAVRGDGTQARMLQNSKRRDEKQAAERVYTQRQYEANHDD
jgi:putative FmdB family regulatory protein